MKNKYVLQFLHRGAICGGFGPIIMGVVYMLLSLSIEDFSLSGTEVLLATLSTYLLAFLQAGASVFNQIEHWPLSKSLFFHFSTLYLAYVLCYIVNSWIPFEPLVLAIFTLAFVLTYLVIYLTVVLTVKAIGKRFNQQLK